MIKIMTQVFYITGKYLLNGHFLRVFPKAVFRNQPKVYGGAFLQKQLSSFCCQFFLHKRPTINVRLQSKSASVASKEKRNSQYDFTSFYIILHNSRSCSVLAHIKSNSALLNSTKVNMIRQMSVAYLALSEGGAKFSEKGIVKK